MLSYRHGFHAGNHADLLKHTVLVHSLDYLLQKEKPLRIIDTHAGAGLYRLNSPQAQKTNEYVKGIGKLWQMMLNMERIPTPLERYLDLIKQFNPSQQLLRYPGSPLLTSQLMRPQDQLYLHELHPADARQLQESVNDLRNVKVIDDDGFHGLHSLLPPPDRRGFVLIDPSYEVKSDYQRVAKEVIKAHKRFATGTFAIWYPVVLRERVLEMENMLIKSGIRNIQVYELGLREDNPDFGMTASGMLVINPPWTLWKAMEETLPWLMDHFADADAGGFYRLEQLVGE